MRPIVKRPKETGNERTKLLFITLLLVAASLVRSGNADSLVIVAQEHGLGAINLETLEVVPLLSDGSAPYAVDAYEEETGNFTLFWSDVVNNAVYTGQLVDGGLRNITVLAQTEVGSIEGVAVDWVGRRVYWVVSAIGAIEVSHLDGKQRAPLIVGIQKPRALALDPHHRLLFWSDLDNAAPRIERSTLDGQQRRVIVRLDPSDRVGWINSIALDRLQRRIVWVDARSNSIHIATYDGDNQQTLVAHHHLLRHAFGIALLNDTVMWSDYSSNSVIMMDSGNKSLSRTLFHSNSKLFGLSIISPGLQLKESNECETSSKPCSHLCLLAEGHEPSCHCPYGTLPDHEKANSCQKQNFMLLLALSPSGAHSPKDTVMVLRQSVADPSWPLASPLGLQDLQTEAVVLDWRLGSVMWLDATSRFIYWRPQGPNSSYKRMDISKVAAMAVDPNSGKVYAASSALSSVIVECDVSSCTPLVQNLGDIVALAASPRLLVWMHSMIGQMHVEGMFTDTSERFGIASGFQLSCLSVDPLTHDVLWVDELNPNRILQRKSISSGPTREYSLPFPSRPVRSVSALNSTIFVAYEDSVWMMNATSTWQRTFVPCNKGRVTTMKLVQLQPLEGTEQNSSTMAGIQRSPSSLVVGNAAAEWTCSRVCHNGGSCVVTSTNDEVCWCPPTYWGSRCELDACGCERGQCVLRSRQLMCQCPRGYTGVRCEQQLCTDTCGHGECIRDGVRQWCRCQKGWAGTRCMDIELSATSCVPVCENGGMCVGVDRCRCPSNYTGRRCEIFIAIQVGDCQKSSYGQYVGAVIAGVVLVTIILVVLLVVLAVWSRRKQDTFVPSSFLHCKSRHNERKTEKNPSLLSLVFCPEKCRTEDHHILLRSSSTASDTGV